MTMTTHAMQLSLMIEPVEVDNLQITVSQRIKTSAPHDTYSHKQVYCQRLFVVVYKLVIIVLS